MHSPHPLATDTSAKSGFQAAAPLKAPSSVWRWVGISLCVCTAIGLGFWMGQSQQEDAPKLPPMLAAASSATDTMAVATGPISDDAEGIFFLDFITGNLQCLVYYPRARAFGAQYSTNVAQQLGNTGKNAKYIMVTGGAITRATTGGARPGASLVYVTDTVSGMFAAYAVPWDRTAESAGRTQTGPLFYAGGGPIRNFNLAAVGQGNQPAAIVDPNNKPPQP